MTDVLLINIIARNVYNCRDTFFISTENLRLKNVSARMVAKNVDNE
jgi:hypothetical protein